MLICDVIQNIKNYHKGERDGVKINDATTRDQVLYGDTNRECTGIVTTIYASPEVIEKAHQLGANLIISHETLFWNRGGHVEWLEDSGNKAYFAKKAMLDEYGITVWRDHDYMHSGIPDTDGSYVDGIYTGVMNRLGWNDYLICDKSKPMLYQIPEIKASDLVEYIKEKYNITGVKFIGSPDTMVKKVWICGHIMENNNDQITFADVNDVDCMLPLELIDYTLLAYVRDSALSGHKKCIISMGHFNIEEPGMDFMTTWIDKAIGQHIDCTFVQAGDMYQYL